MPPPSSATVLTKGKQKILIPMVAISAYIWDCNDDSSDDKQFIKFEKDQSIIHPEVLRPVTPRFLSLSSTSNTISQQRSTEEKSPTQQALPNRQSKTTGNNGLVNEFLTFTPEPHIKSESHIQSEFQLVSGSVLSITTLLRTRAETREAVRRNHVLIELETDGGIGINVRSWELKLLMDSYCFLINHSNYWIHCDKSVLGCRNWLWFYFFLFH